MPVTNPHHKPVVALFMPEQTGARVFSEASLALLDSLAQQVSGFFPQATVNDQLDQLKEVEVFFTGWHSPRIDESILAAAPKLKAVLHTAGSVNPYTSDAFWNRNIPISSAFTINNRPVAEFAQAQIVLALKGYWQSISIYRETKKMPYQQVDVPGLKNATVGLISLGSIARMVVSHLDRNDIRLIAYDPYVEPAEASDYGVELVSLEELFANSQVVSCHTPLTDETRWMITEDHLIRMPLNGTFINTARGAIIHTPGLINALRARPDLHAILDVTDPEPLPSDSALLTLPNASISAHIAGSIGNESYLLGDGMIKELKRYISGQALEWAIRREQALL